MQYQVPQFLDVEDKIIGPLTMKQFLYAAGGLGGGYMAWKLIPWGMLAIIPALAILGLGLALGFYKFNRKPFAEVVQAFVMYILHPRLYIWKRKSKQIESEIEHEIGTTPKVASSAIPAVGPESKLSNLTWQIDLQPAPTIEPDTLSAKIEK